MAPGLTGATQREIRSGTSLTCLALPCQRASSIRPTAYASLGYVGLRPRSGYAPFDKGRFARPCNRLTYTSTSAGRSPAQIASSKKAVFGAPAYAPFGFSLCSKVPFERLCLSSVHFGANKRRGWHFRVRSLSLKDTLRSLPRFLPSPPATFIDESPSSYFVARLIR